VLPVCRGRLHEIWEASASPTGGSTSSSTWSCLASPLPQLLPPERAPPRIRRASPPRVPRLHPFLQGRAQHLSTFRLRPFVFLPGSGRRGLDILTFRILFVSGFLAGGCFQLTLCSSTESPKTGAIHNVEMWRLFLRGFPRGGPPQCGKVEAAFCEVSPGGPWGPSPMGKCGGCFW
jgi:hypothetical protein